MDPVSKQRGETWTAKDRRRTEFQHRFAVCWIGVAVGSLLLKVLLLAFNIVLTRELLQDTTEVNGTPQHKNRVFTGYRWYDNFAMGIAWLGAVVVLWQQWKLKRPTGQLVATLKRNIPVTVAFFVCKAMLDWLTAEKWISFQVSGHYQVYILASYLHYHNAKVAFVDLDRQLFALLLLANIPFMMYSAVWTAIAFHEVWEVSFGAMFALGITYISHLLEFDK